MDDIYILRVRLLRLRGRLLRLRVRLLRLRVRLLHLRVRLLHCLPGSQQTWGDSRSTLI